MGLTVTVLGCSGSYPGPGGAASGYLVRGGGATVWLDAGSGTLANLQRHVGLDELDAIVLSHAHVDHWSDLQAFSIACRFVVSRTGVPVYGPDEVQEAAAGYTEPFAWHVVTDGSAVRIGGQQWTFSRTDHGGETLAARVDGDGRVLGYSADSGPAWSMEALGPGLDLAVCEATFLEDREGSLQHWSGRQAGLTARAAGAARLMVTHVWPTVDRAAVAAEAAGAFGAPVMAAEVGLTVAL